MGEVNTTIHGIKEECSHFCEALSSWKPIDNSLDDYFLRDMPTLSEESSDQCMITLDGCKLAIKLM